MNWTMRSDSSLNHCQTTSAHAKTNTFWTKEPTVATTAKRNKQNFTLFIIIRTFLKEKLCLFETVKPKFTSIFRCQVHRTNLLSLMIYGMNGMRSSVCANDDFC